MAITIDQFFAKYKGKPVEVAGPGAKNQCVDLANAYIREVLNKPIIEHTNAEDFPAKIKPYGTWVANSRDNHPPKGAIVVWDFESNDVGHIDIAAGPGDRVNFEGFDQNWPTGSVCHFVVHTYTGVIGWLIPATKEATMPGKLINDSQGRVWNEFDGQYFYVRDPKSIAGIPVENREPQGILLIPKSDCPANDCRAIEKVLSDKTEELRLCSVDKKRLTDELGEIEASNEKTQKNCVATISELQKDIEKNHISKARPADLIRELMGRLISWSTKK